MLCSLANVTANNFWLSTNYEKLLASRSKGDDKKSGTQRTASKLTNARTKSLLSTIIDSLSKLIYCLIYQL